VDEIVLVGGSTRIPKIQQLLKDFFNGKEPYGRINPDEAVAYGAALQGGSMSSDPGNLEFVLLDVNPLTLGIETKGGIMSKLITRNTVIPVKRESVYTTTEDNQDNVDVRVYEGERSMTKDNHLLGSFQLTNIPLSPRGEVNINVYFEIDVHGILHVSAEEKTSGSKNKITIKNDQKGLKQDDIDRMIKDAQKFAEQDNKEKDRVETRNQLESSAYRLKRDIVDKGVLAGKLSGSDVKFLSKLADDTITWLDDHPSTTLEEIKEQWKNFERLVQIILSKLDDAVLSASFWSNRNSSFTKSEL